MLLHGFMQDATVWASIAEALAVSHYVAAPTMAPARANLASLGDLAEGVYGVVQQAIIHTHCRKVLLVGYSMGGRVALEYARRYPETLDGLVIESASLGPETEEKRAALETRNYSWASQFEAAESMEEVVNAWESEPLFATQHKLDEEDRALMRKIRLRSNKEQLSWILRGAGAHTMPLASETREFLAQLNTPVLYIAGQHDEKRMAEAAQLDALGAPHIHTARFACGHNVHLENPVTYTEHIRTFIKEEL